MLHAACCILESAMLLFIGTTVGVDKKANFVGFFLFVDNLNMISNNFVFNLLKELVILKCGFIISIDGRNCFYRI